MLTRTVKIKSIEEGIFPLSKAFENVSEVTDLRSIAYYKGMAGSAFIRGEKYGNSPGLPTAEMIIVRCAEHDRPELVFGPNYRDDLSYWYEIDRHPRFSIMGALLGEDQTGSERHSILLERTLIRKALETANTQKEFIEAVRPRLMTNLSVGGRRHRVTHSFKERFKKRDFTVDDFFQEQNQEIRRVILRVVPIHEVINRLNLISEDEEGKIYETEMRRRYLYVKCPSTGQEYLLEVPDHMDSPKEARRWTFDLPVDAVFAKEA